MFRVTDVLRLKPDERIHAVLRRHAGVLFSKLVWPGLLLVAPFFFMFPLFHASAFGLLAFVVLVATGAMLAARAFFLWDADVLVITSERLVDVDQRAVWVRIVGEMPLASIQGIRWERAGFGQTFWRTGTLRILGSGALTELVAPDLAHPEQIQNLIQSIRARSTSAAVRPS